VVSGRVAEATCKDEAIADDGRRTDCGNGKDAADETKAHSATTPQPRVAGCLRCAAYINLESSTARRQRVAQELARLDLPVHRFPAVRIPTDCDADVAFELLPEAPHLIAPQEFVAKYRGSVGSLMSHCKLGKRLHTMAAAEGWTDDDWVLVCEDDVVFSEHGPRLLDRALSMVASNYDAALLDTWAPMGSYALDPATAEDPRAAYQTIEIRQIPQYYWEHAIGAHALLLRVRSLAEAQAAAYEGLQRAIASSSEPTVDPFYAWQLPQFCVVSCGIVRVDLLNWDGSSRDSKEDDTSFWNDEDAFWDLSRLEL